MHKKAEGLQAYLRQETYPMQLLTLHCLSSAVPDRGDYFWDDYLLAHLVKGSCLAYMNSPLQAEECFKFIVNNEKKIKEDNYLVPNALLELGLLLLRANDLEQSRIILEHAK